MRALLLTVGSRGDVEPFAALAQSLWKAGHSVDLWLPHDMQPYAATEHVNVHAFDFGTMDFYKFLATPSHGADHPNPRVRFTGVVADIIGQLVLPSWRAVSESYVMAEEKEPSSSRPTVIVASSLARPLAMGLAALWEIPVLLVQLQPLVPTRDFPHNSHTDECVHAIVDHKTPPNDTQTQQEENFKSYWELEGYQYEFLQAPNRDVYDEMRISEKFPTLDELQCILTGQNDRVIMVNAFSNHLIPVCTDHEKVDNIWNVGALADDYLPHGWEPSQELVDFVNKNNKTASKPICVGYGSMPFDKTQMILEVIQRVETSAILVGSAMKDVQVDDPSRILVLESVPYSFVLKHCSMMLSHGGAGAIHAALRAGIPSVVSPFMGDQFFWAQLLQAKGLGAPAGTLSALTVDKLVEGIEKARACTEACEKVGASIREQETGVSRLVNLLEGRL